MKYFLSIDYGGTNTKAIVFDEEGRQLGQSAFSTKKIEEKAGCREVDLKETWQGIRQAMRQAVKMPSLRQKTSALLPVLVMGKASICWTKTVRNLRAVSCLQMSERSSWLKNLRSG